MSERYSIRKGAPVNGERWQIVGHYREADDTVTEIVIGRYKGKASALLAARVISGRQPVTVED